MYYKNQASDSRYGFWLGWSFNNLVLENTIERNSHDGVAIGCGQFNRIEGNRFVDTGAVPIHVWTEDQNVGLSRQYLDRRQRHRKLPSGVLLEKTTEYFIDANRLKNAPLPPGLASTMKKPERTGRQVFEGMPAFKRVEEIVAAKPRISNTSAKSRGCKGASWCATATSPRWISAAASAAPDRGVDSPSRRQGDPTFRPLWFAAAASRSHPSAHQCKSLKLTTHRGTPQQAFPTTGY